MNNPATKRLLTEVDVENEYGLPRRTLQARRQLGQPPSFVKVGARVYYERSAIEEFITSCTHTPARTE